MHSFHYEKGSLHCEGVDLQTLAGDHGTPLYVYSAGTIRDHFTRLDAALGELDHMICYAVKANSNLAILDLLQREGSGFDIVSGGELFDYILTKGRLPRREALRIFAQLVEGVDQRVGATHGLSVA